MKVYKHIFDSIIAPENLFSAWDAFKSGKLNKKDVQYFEWRLEQNIFALHRDLKHKIYVHQPYTGFYITDPKRRHIHKASVRDRILHHAVYSILNPLFETTFIPTSFSCRVGFGSHKGVEVFERMTKKVSRNGKRPCYVLKCDVRKFFDSIDHHILLSIIEKRIKDPDVMWLLKEIIKSFESGRSAVRAVGIPIGNLTSQLFANVYMNEFDQFMKHELRVKYYARYTDDFIIVSEDKQYLEHLLPLISQFLKDTLALELHPNKSILLSICQGIDFLGYVVFPHHRLLRTKTKRRLMKKMKQRMKQYEEKIISYNTFNASLQSYLGMFSHANTYEFQKKFLNQFWVYRDRE